MARGAPAGRGSRGGGVKGKGRPGAGKPAKPSGRAVKRGGNAVAEHDDEEDDFHAARLSGKSKIALDPEDDDDDEDDDDQHALMGIAADDDDEEDDDDDDEDDEEEEEEDVDDGRGHLAKLARQERLLRTKLLAGADEDPDGPGDGDGGDATGWGAHKGAYYDADDGDDGLDEDDEGAEATEALRLQRASVAGLRPEDLGLEGDDVMDDVENDGIDDGDDGDESLGRLATRGVTTEAVDKARTGPAAAAAAAGQAPELPALLAELQSSLVEIRVRLAPVLARVKSGGLPTAAGVSLLEAKHLLLLSYCTHVCFYLLLRAEGRPARDHPVVERLVELRAYLEKLRPLEKKLKYQIDKMLSHAATLPVAGVAAPAEAEAMANGGQQPPRQNTDALRFRARPESMVPKTGGRGGTGMGDDGGDEVYRPPRLAPAAMPEPKARGKRDKGGANMRSRLLDEIAAEVTGGPEEMRGLGESEAAEAGGQGARAARKAREQNEEATFTRAPLSREEVKAAKQLERRGMVAQMAEFGEDVTDLAIAATAAGDSGRVRGRDGRDAAPRGRRTLAEMLAGSVGGPPGRRGLPSGDEDLPRRPPRRDRGGDAGDDNGDGNGDGNGDDDGDGNGDGEGGGRRGGRVSVHVPLEDEDDAYVAAADASRHKKRAKAELYAAPGGVFPDADESAEGRRGISRTIAKNRGLTPHRNKLARNPRAKLRHKFQKAAVRRSGTVRTASPGAGGGAYGGEASGIKSSVSRSRKL